MKSVLFDNDGHKIKGSFHISTLLIAEKFSSQCISIRENSVKFVAQSKVARLLAENKIFSCVIDVKSVSFYLN